MTSIVSIPWYATVFRGDKFELALAEIAPIALRYGATEYAVFRFQDDRYKYQQMAAFEDKGDFELYWYGEEFSAWRADYSGWFQVPVVYGWTVRTSSGTLEPNGSVIP
jgi:hypothetical protein